MYIGAGLLILPVVLIVVLVGEALAKTARLSPTLAVIICVAVINVNTAVEPLLSFALFLPINDCPDSGNIIRGWLSNESSNCAHTAESMEDQKEGVGIRFDGVSYARGVLSYWL